MSIDTVKSPEFESGADLCEMFVDRIVPNHSIWPLGLFLLDFFRDGKSLIFFSYCVRVRACVPDCLAAHSC